MSAIKKNTGHLRATASQLNGYRDRVSHLGSDLDAALRPARRGDVPELGQIEATYGPLRSRMSNSATTMDIQARNLRQYADRSDQIELLIAHYTSSMSLILKWDSLPGRNSSGKTGKKEDRTSDHFESELSEDSPLKERQFGQKPREESPFLGPTVGAGRDWKLREDKATLFEFEDGGWIPRRTSLVAKDEVVAFGSATAGRVAGGYRVEAKGGVRAAVSLKATDRIGTKKVNVNTSAALTAEAEASVKASGEFSKEGMRGQVGGKIGVEAKAELKGGAKLSGVEATGGGSLSVGLGARADVGGAFSRKKIGVEFDVGARIGIGGGLKGGVSVDPEEVLGDAKHVAGKAAHAVEHIDLPDVDVPHIKKSDLDPRGWF